MRMTTLLASASAWLPPVDELQLLAPELVLIATLVVVLLVPLASGRRSPAVAMIVILGGLIGLGATLSTATSVGGGPERLLAAPGHPPILLVDGLTVFFRFLIFALLLLITWLWLAGLRGRGGAVMPIASAAAPPEFFVLLLTSALGMLLMVSSLNLLLIVIAMETASLPSYAIVAADKRSRLGAEAALKYVTFGAAASAIMIFGISLLYGQFGTLDLPSLAAKLSRHGAIAAATDVTVFWLSILAVGVGVLFKIAAAPMHLWCPDVFEGAPVEVTTWLSIASKAAGVGLLLRLAHTLAGHSGLGTDFTPLALAIGVLASVTCTVGNLAALRQDSVKRMLAYSSIAHAGYMMMAAAILQQTAAANQATVGTSAIIAYLMVYVLMNVGAFGVTAVVAWHAGTDHVTAFTGLGRRAPWLALPMALCLFSLIGLPPLGGFAAKWFLILALGKGAAVAPWLWILVFVAVINTAISLYYYVRVIRQMYLRDDAELGALPAPLGGVVLVNLCALALLLLGTLWFSPLGQSAALLAAGVLDAPPSRGLASPG